MKNKAKIYHWILTALFAYMVAYSLSAQTGYNLYAIDRLDSEQIVELSRQMETGMDLRFGGNEYVTSDIPFYKAMELAVRTGSPSVSLSTVREDVAKAGVSSLGNYLGHVTYGNEPWLKVSPYIGNIWHFLFNKSKWVAAKCRYYESEARKYMNAAQEFERATGIVPVVNVPTPQNPWYKAWTEEVSKWSPQVVSIHVYGKPWEVGYYESLDEWVRYIVSKFDEVIVGEFNGIELHTHPEYAGTEQEELSRVKILEIFDRYGITEVYWFTLVADSEMMKWRNAPVYPKYVIE